MIVKKDWERALEQFESLLVNALINIECYQSAIEIIKTKISEFTDEKTDDKMPDDLKEIFKDSK